MQEKKEDQFDESELSEVWRELLGTRLAQPGAPPPPEAAIPTLDNDPWRELVQANGTEVVDMSKLDLHMSDQEIERMLQIIQDQPAAPPGDDPKQQTK
ncbi:MAG: hypothetical protein J2P37_08880 [Ktedonobacteraceae bacterium]|nr:hypothetical protein [Ktedonobacteraceae bacterium]MBO0790627.1 hypothetical protein [Ktedonobacteraceae bacterium]